MTNFAVNLTCVSFYHDDMSLITDICINSPNFKIYKHMDLLEILGRNIMVGLFDICIYFAILGLIFTVLWIAYDCLFRMLWMYVHWRYQPRQDRVMQREWTARIPEVHAELRRQLDVFICEMPRLLRELEDGGRG